MDDERLTLEQNTVPITLPVIKHSEQVDKILSAMLKAQKTIEHAHKDSENPHFHSSYASLNAYIDACKQAYNENSIVVIQGTGGTDKLIRVATRLAHISGQWYECGMEGAPEKSGPQPKGSVITYFRRYTLSALGFMGAEDDDGNAGQAEPPKKKTGTKKQAKAEPPAADRAASLKAFHEEWESLVAEVEDCEDADANRNLENVFLHGQTAKGAAFKLKHDYMRPLDAEIIGGLTAMLKESRPDIVAWLETDSVRKAINLPTLSVETCPGCAEILTGKDKVDSRTVGLDKGWCEKCRPDAVVAMMKKKGEKNE